MIVTGRFGAFIEEFVEMYRDEELEKIRWEYWLHRVYDQSFSDYKKSLGMIKSSAAPTRDEQIKAVQKSRMILSGFCPAKVGGNGDIQTSGNHSNQE